MTDLTLPERPRERLVAAYVVNITLRELPGVEDGEVVQDAPTTTALDRVLTMALKQAYSNTPHVTSFRTNEEGE